MKIEIGESRGHSGARCWRRQEPIWSRIKTEFGSKTRCKRLAALYRQWADSKDRNAQSPPCGASHQFCTSSSHRGHTFSPGLRDMSCALHCSLVTRTAIMPIFPSPIYIKVSLSKSPSSFLFTQKNVGLRPQGDLHSSKKLELRC